MRSNSGNAHSDALQFGIDPIERTSPSREMRKDPGQRPTSRYCCNLRESIEYLKGGMVRCTRQCSVLLPVSLLIILAVARRNVIRREWLNSFWPKREL